MTKACMNFLRTLPRTTTCRHSWFTISSSSIQWKVQTYSVEPWFRHWTVLKPCSVTTTTRLNAKNVKFALWLTAAWTPSFTTSADLTTMRSAMSSQVREPVNYFLFNICKMIFKLLKGGQLINSKTIVQYQMVYTLFQAYHRHTSDMSLHGWSGTHPILFSSTFEVGDEALLGQRILDWKCMVVVKAAWTE